jgi:membrane dipeptidase
MEETGSGRRYVRCVRPSAFVAGLALVVACRAAPQPPDAAPPPASAQPVETAAAAPPETFDERVARVHAAAIIVDGHDDIPTIIAQTGFDLGRPNGKTATDLPKMKAGGITAEFFSIFVDRAYAEHPTSAGGGAARRALDLIDLTYRQIERYPNDLVLARTVDDVRRAKSDGKIAVMMGIEGGHAIENSLSALRDFYRLGVRYMTLTHTNTNGWADSSGMFGPAPVKHHGLTSFGEEVVREMQRIGMLVDVSHVSDETFFDVMKTAKTPVIASHSSVRAIADVRRNVSDDMLRALAQNGGVCMVNFWPAFLDPASMAAMRASKPLPPTPISVVVDHIDHVVAVAGIDHVGLGSDFDGVDSLPKGLGGLDELPNLTRALLERGYSDDDTKKILGENFLRVLAAAEAYAKSTETTLSGDGALRAFSE